MDKRTKNLTPSEAKKRIYQYCAYQERSHQEARDKLYELGIDSKDADEILTQLITEGYLNEERFAKTFAGGKFRLKKWGRVKIVQALEAKGLTKNCINLGLKEIEDGEYRKTVESLIEKKLSQLDEANLFVKREKLATYIIQKGFEPELVWEILRTTVK